MALITVRNLGSNYDPVNGNGAADFLSDLNAVTQIIGTSLRLFEGEFWAQPSAGLPLFQSILGASGASLAAVSAAIQAVIMGVPYVSSVSVSQLTMNPVSRSLAFQCEVQTQFGAVSVGTP